MKKINLRTLAACLLIAIFVGVFFEKVLGIMGCEPKCPAQIDWMYVILIILTIVAYFVCAFRFGKKDEEACSDKIDKTYQVPVFLIIASVAIAVIFMISGIIAPVMRGDESQVDSETITNFYTAFIALCTTFVVGFQIYNSLELNKKMEKLDVAKQETEKQLADLKKKLIELDADKLDLEKQVNDAKAINKRCEYFNAYTIGTIRYNEAEMNKKPNPEASKRYCWNAIRAYFNALKFASEGGQDYKEAWESFGQNKISNCIDILIQMHKDYPHGENDGDRDSVMPSYEDRMRYINDTKKAIKGIKTSDLDDNLSSELDNLKAKWNTFLKEYYPNLK